MNGIRKPCARRDDGVAARPFSHLKEEDFQMLSWALCFLVIAVVAGLLGFTGIAGTAAWIAQALFIVFLVLFAIVMIARSGSRSPPL